MKRTGCALAVATTLSFAAQSAAARVVYLEPVPLPETMVDPQDAAHPNEMVREIRDTAWRVAGDAGLTRRVPTQHGAEAVLAHAALIGDEANVSQLFDFRLPDDDPQPDPQRARKSRTLVDLLMPRDIPEPSAWMLLTAGFFAIGAGLRHHRRTSATARR